MLNNNTSTRDKIIKAAEELIKALCYVSPVCNGLHDATWRGIRADNLRSLIALVPKDGELVVPEEPTVEMANAGARDLEHSGFPALSRDAAECYKAMLKAAKEDK